MPAPRDGVVTRLGALDVGVAALELGAGRRTKADPVDHAVGILCFAKRGDTVLEGDDLAEVHARDDETAERAAAAVLAAYEIGERGARRITASCSTSWRDVPSRRAGGACP